MSIIVRSDGPTRRDAPALEPLHQRRMQPRTRGDSVPALLGQDGARIATPPTPDGR